MARRVRRAAPSVECSSYSIRSKIAKEAAQAAVSELMHGPAFQEIVDKTVDASLKRLGFNVEKPDEMQDNLRHLGDWVDIAKLVRNRGIGAVVLTLVTFTLAAVGYGVTLMFKQVQLPH